MTDQKIYFVRCMCGHIWPMGRRQLRYAAKPCPCGATLYRNGAACRATVENDYPLADMPFPSPGLFMAAPDYLIREVPA